MLIKPDESLRNFKRSKVSSLLIQSISIGHHHVLVFVAVTVYLSVHGGPQFSCPFPRIQSRSRSASAPKLDRRP